MATCCLPECKAPVFIRFVSPELGDREYPLCFRHIKKHSKNMDLLKSILKAMAFESLVTPRTSEEPAHRERLDDDDWEPDL